MAEESGEDLDEFQANRSRPEQGEEGSGEREEGGLEGGDLLSDVRKVLGIVRVVRVGALGEEHHEHLQAGTMRRLKKEGRKW